MTITDLVAPEAILPALKVISKKQALQELASRAAALRGRRDASVMGELLAQDDNHEVSAPAPAHALFLERVEYPKDLYLRAE